MFVGLWTFANGNEVLGRYTQTKVPLKDEEVFLLFCVVRVSVLMMIMFVEKKKEKQKDLKHQTRLGCKQRVKERCHYLIYSVSYMLVESMIGIILIQMIYMFVVERTSESMWDGGKEILLILICQYFEC